VALVFRALDRRRLEAVAIVLDLDREHIALEATLDEHVLRVACLAMLLTASCTP